MVIQMCYFCEEGKDFSIAKRKLGSEWPFENEIVYADENVFSIVGSAPQVIPYILILPYRHIYSVTEMTYTEKDSLISCMNFLVGRGGYGETICFFEHGGKSETGSSSIDHCHVHIIDSKYGLFVQERFDGFQQYCDIPSSKAIKGSYLMVGEFSKNGIHVKISNQEANERQFFRRRLAEIIGETQWDWREDNHIDRMISIMKRFRG